MENTAIALHQSNAALAPIDRERVELWKRTFCRGASDDQLNLFVGMSQRLGLNPEARQICMIPIWDSNVRAQVMVPVVTIDGFRSNAAKSAEYEGQTPPEWCGKDGVWRDVWLQDGFPVAARVGVWRRGFREPVFGIAKWSTYCATNKEGQPKSNWAKMPDLMLAKCAEMLALRKAFPHEFSGVYGKDEMEQAIVDVTPEQPKQVTQRQPQQRREPVKQAPVASEPIPMDDIPFQFEDTIQASANHQSHDDTSRARNNNPPQQPTNVGVPSLHSANGTPTSSTPNRAYEVIEKMHPLVKSTAVRELLDMLKKRKLQDGDAHFITRGIREGEEGKSKTLLDLIKARPE